MHSGLHSSATFTSSGSYTWPVIESLLGEAWSVIRSVAGATIVCLIGTILFGLMPRKWRTVYRRYESLIGTAALGIVPTLGLGAGIAIIAAGDRFAATPKDAQLGGALMIGVALPGFYFAWRAYTAQRSSSAD
jgi:hypothetical protein